VFLPRSGRNTERMLLCFGLSFLIELRFERRAEPITQAGIGSAGCNEIVTRILASNSYDVILCNHVLEHVSEDRRALRKIFRVLKPGGWTILQVPICTTLAETLEDPTITTPAQRLRAYGQSDHVRLYGRDYPTRIMQAGFDLEQFHWKTQNPSQFGGEQNLYGLILEETLWAIKPPNK